MFSDAVAPDLLNLRPLLVPAVAALIDTPAFRRVLERALRARHRTLLEGESRFVLELGRGVRFVQDTPLGAERPAELRCSPFRGRADAPLLLLNHWIPPFPPSVRDNARIGGQELKGRFERCETERGQLPNLLAVDFYEQSDVIEISAQRNRSR